MNKPVEPARIFLDALYELEKLIQDLPAGARRHAAVELVVARVRRLKKCPTPTDDDRPDAATQLELQGILPAPGAPAD